MKIIIIKLIINQIILLRQIK